MESIISKQDMDKIQALMDKVYHNIRRILADNLVGVYFHGSLRLGSFSYSTSDLDYIIVVNEPINKKDKKLLCDFTLEIWKEFPHKGAELSVVLKKYCSEFVYPTPYELHMSGDWVERYRTDIQSVINDKFKTDIDLASHFNVINQKNDMLDYGEPMEKVFAVVPEKYVIKSNYEDIRNCKTDILNNPVYVCLNLCRFYALLRDKKTLSKYHGADYVLSNGILPTKFENLIKNCQNCYKNNKKIEFDKNCLNEFAEFMINKINTEFDYLINEINM